MAAKYAYRSVEPKFGFRVDATTKLEFNNADNTEFPHKTWGELCEEYVTSGLLERIGDDPFEGEKREATPTTVYGPNGKKSTKSAAPNIDAREKKGDDSKSEPKKDTGK